MFRRRSLSGTMLAIASLTLLVGVLAAGGAVVLGIGARQAQQDLRRQNQVNQGIQELKTLTTQVAMLNAQRILVPTEKSIQQGLVAALAALSKRSEAVGALPMTDTERQAIRAYQGAITTFVTFFNTPIAAEQLRDPKFLKRMGDLYTADLAAVDRTQHVAGQAATAELAVSDSRVGRVITQLVTVVIALTVVAGLGVGTFLFWTARSIKGQLLRMTRVLSALHGGDLRERVGAAGSDELSTMGRSLDETLDRLCQVFSGIGDASTQLSHSSTQLQEVAGRVGTAANGAAAQAQSASTTANDVSSSVQAVAVGSDEMGTSISEIARNAQQAVEVASSAVTSVEDTTGRMAKLSDSSREIGDVVRLITSIAEQTNLLALNATIEAARAGDAGKGFAVVADEVKQLAQETARATEDISRRVEAIQADAEQANDAIGDIANVIGRINEFQTTIASAVEEQTATTQDINRGVNHAASGSTQIAQNISELASAAETTALAAAETRSSADQLAGMSSRLNELIATFRY